MKAFSIPLPIYKIGKSGPNTDLQNWIKRTSQNEGCS